MIKKHFDKTHVIFVEYELLNHEINGAYIRTCLMYEIKKKESMIM